MPQDIEDKDIDTSEVPELEDAFFKDARLTRPGEDLLQEAFEVPPISLRVPDMDMDEGSNDEEDEVTGDIPNDLFAAVTAEEEPAPPQPVIDPQPAPPPPVQFPPLYLAARDSQQAAAAIANGHGCGAVVIVYDQSGAFQYRSQGLNVTFAVGLLQRTIIALIEAAGKEMPPPINPQ